MSGSPTLRSTLPVKVLCTGLLLWALWPHNPYGYYVLLRWICCAAFMYLALRAVRGESAAWAWIFGTAAGIYNPILRVHLTRPIWSVVNVLTIVFLIASAVDDYRMSKRITGEQDH